MRKEDRNPDDVEAGYRLQCCYQAEGYRTAQAFARDVLRALKQPITDRSLKLMVNKIYQYQIGSSGMPKGFTRMLEHSFGWPRRFVLDGDILSITDRDMRRRIREQLGYESPASCKPEEES